MNYDLSTDTGMANAIAWQTKMISVLAQGGRWIVPRSMSVYEIDHERKTARRVLGYAPEPDIAKVFEAMGWTVTEDTAL